MAFMDWLAGGGRRVGMDAASTGEAVASGVTAGAVFGGPVGALLGAGVGLLRSAGRRSALDAMAADAALAEHTRSALMASLAQTQSALTDPYDKMQAENIGRQIAVLQKGTVSSDPDVRAQSQAQLVQYFGDIDGLLQDAQGGAAAEFEYKRGRLDALADQTQADYEQSLDAARGLQSTGASIHSILASDLPTDSPLFAGSLISLLEQSQRNMLVDPYGTSEYIQDTVGRIPGVGGMLGAWLGGKAELAENTFTREQWRQIADSFLVGGKQAQAGAMQQAVQRAQMLQQSAQQLGYDPVVDYARQVETGKLQPIGGVGGPGQYQDVEVPALEGSPGWGAFNENVTDPVGAALGDAAAGTADAFSKAGRAVMGVPKAARQGAADAYRNVVDFIAPYAKPLVEGAPPEQPAPVLRGRIERKPRTPRGTDRSMNR